jgi:beta-lactamase class A
MPAACIHTALFALFAVAAGQIARPPMGMKEARPRHNTVAAIKRELEGLIRVSGAESVSVAFHSLETGRSLELRSREAYHAASTMKVPVMMAIFQMAHEGELSLDDRLIVRNDFSSLVDGSRFSTDPESDGDTTIYKHIGRELTVRELTERMITLSSNLATNLLVERVTSPRVMDLVRSLGAHEMRVLRGVEDGKAYERGLNNTTTAHDLLILMRGLAERHAVAPEASDEMLKILRRQTERWGVPAGLPVCRSPTKQAHSPA